MSIVTSFSMMVLIFLVIFLPTWFAIKRQKKIRSKKRSPLVANLLRSPGESLREKIEELREKIDDRVTNILFLFIGALVLAVFCIGNKANVPTTFLMFFIFSLVAVSVTLYNVRHLSALWKTHHDYRLALDAELAVGQELNHLMRDGYSVFHDFLFEKFNIDHIVVGSKGIFAVETKGKAKPNRGMGAKDATIEYDGKNLIFPGGFRNKDPIDQAKRQAQSLAKWLTSVVGESIMVTPALAFPGWFIKKTSPGNFLFLYGTYQNYRKILRGQKTLEDKLIKRICHQLEQRCRNVEPKAYKTE